MNFTNC